MKQRGMLFSAPMVRAIIDGSKTQTRRTIKPQPFAKPEYDDETGLFGVYAGDELSGTIRCPYGRPGDRLWVREGFSGPHYQRKSPPKGWSDSDPIWYWADGNPEGGDWTKPKPSIHMPRWASRITLEITGVRVERLQDISEADAVAEGARRFDDIPMVRPSAHPNRWSMEQPTNTDQCLSSAKWAFANFFCKLGGKALPDFSPWDANPWVWVIEFQKI